MQNVVKSSHLFHTCICFNKVATLLVKSHWLGRSAVANTGIREGGGSNMNN